MVKIVLQCCAGKEGYSNQCLGDRCPHYRKAEQSVRRAWPWLSTGFGNAYGEPRHGHFLNRVQNDFIEKKESSEKPQGGHPFNHWK